MGVAGDACAQVSVATDDWKGPGNWDRNENGYLMEK